MNLIQGLFCIWLSQMEALEIWLSKITASSQSFTNLFIWEQLTHSFYFFVSVDLYFRLDFYHTCINQKGSLKLFSERQENVVAWLSNHCIVVFQKLLAQKLLFYGRNICSDIEIGSIQKDLFPYFFPLLKDRNTISLLVRKTVFENVFVFLGKNLLKQNEYSCSVVSVSSSCIHAFLQFDYTVLYDPFSTAFLIALTRDSHCFVTAFLYNSQVHFVSLA